jgi:hypothetical protein
MAPASDIERCALEAIFSGSADCSERRVSPETEVTPILREAHGSCHHLPVNIVPARCWSTVHEAPRSPRQLKSPILGFSRLRDALDSAEGYSSGPTSIVTPSGPHESIIQRGEIPERFARSHPTHSFATPGPHRLDQISARYRLAVIGPMRGMGSDPLTGESRPLPGHE